MVSKNSKAEAPSTASHTAPKTGKAGNRASPLKRRARLSDDFSPLSSKRVKQESALGPNLNLESHETVPKGTDAADAMTSHHGDAAPQGYQSPKPDMTGDDKVNSVDMVSKYDKALLQGSQHPRHESDMADDDEIKPVDLVSNFDKASASLQGDQSLLCDPDKADDDEIKPADFVSNFEKASLQGDQSRCYEDDVAKETAHPTADSQKQPSDAPTPRYLRDGTLLIRFTHLEGKGTSPFTAAEWERLREVSRRAEAQSTVDMPGILSNLHNDISSFLYYCELIPWDELTVVDRDELEALGNNIKTYLECEYGVRSEYPFLSLTWHILIKNLFSPDCTEKWYGAAWENHGSMIAHFRKHLKDPSSDYASWFHSWRYESARMVYALHGISSNPDRIKGILTEHLGRFMTIPAEADRALDKLVHKATRLELRMQTSPFCFTLSMCHPDTLKRSGFAFSEHWEVEGKALAPGTPVDLICSPWLRGYGRADVKSPIAPTFVYDRFHELNTDQPFIVTGNPTRK